MHIRILRTLMMFFFITLFSSTTLLASETRLAAMGGNPLFVRDNSTILTFPGQLLTYKDLVIAEMRQKNVNSNYTVGLHMDFGNIVGAMYINRPIPSTVFTTNMGLGQNLNTPLNNAFMFIAGTKLSGFNAAFGFMGAMSSFSTGKDATKREEPQSYINVFAGISNKQMDIGLQIELPSITQEIGDQKSELSGFGLQTNGRYQITKYRGMHIFGVANFGLTSSNLKIKDGAEQDISGLNFAVGVGVEKPINEDNLLIVGIEAYNHNALTVDTKNISEATNTISTFPGIYLGVESRIASWLIGRVGARHVNQMLTTEVKPDGGETSETTTDGSGFKISLGLGMEFGNFLLDFGMNEALLFDGPYIFSKVNNNTQFATTISVTYNFGGKDD